MSEETKTVEYERLYKFTVTDSNNYDIINFVLNEGESLKLYDALQEALNIDKDSR